MTIAAEPPLAERLARARALLADAGIHARVDCAGHVQDVLVVLTEPVNLEAVRGASAALRTFGFRYVTIEIAPVDA